MSLDDEMPRPGAEAGEPASDAELPFEHRTITDARTMRALAHPVRIAIIETLSLGGPLTATEIGDRIGESSTTCSFHLRQLAKYGFVEEAGGGKGRARPWRITSVGFSVPSTHADPETDIAANLLSRVARERQLARLLNWVDTRASYPKDWQDAAQSNEYILYLTLGELRQLGAEVHDVFMRWFGQGERLTDPSLRPPGSVPVEYLLFGYPVEVPKTPGAGEPGDAEEGA
jgi:DNA-binding transcriptional ArsR family regulator